MWNKRAFQVLLSIHNGEKYIKRCLESLSTSLRDESWILLIGNDGSTDSTVMEIVEHSPHCNAERVHVFDYPKALTVGEAKNRLIKEAHKFSIRHPAILMIDVDDEMTPERPKMIDTAQKEQSKYVVGAWIRLKLKDNKWKTQTSKLAASAVRGLQFGPWATLFHCDFLPEDGKLFPEDIVNNCGYEDLLTWNYLKEFHGKIPIPHTSNEPVHLYYTHDGSVSNAIDQNKVSFQRNTYWALLDMIKGEKIDIFNKPPDELDIHKGIAAYLMKKQNRKQMERSSEDLSLVLPVHPLDRLDLFNNPNT